MGAVLVVVGDEVGGSVGEHLGAGLVDHFVDVGQAELLHELQHLGESLLRDRGDEDIGKECARELEGHRAGEYERAVGSEHEPGHAIEVGLERHEAAFRGDGEHYGLRVVGKRQPRTGTAGPASGDEQEDDGGGGESAYGTATLLVASGFPSVFSQTERGGFRPVLVATTGTESQSSVWRA